MWFYFPTGVYKNCLAKNHLMSFSKKLRISSEGSTKKPLYTFDVMLAVTSLCQNRVPWPKKST